MVEYDGLLSLKGETHGTETLRDETVLGPPPVVRLRVAVYAYPSVPKLSSL